MMIDYYLHKKCPLMFKGQKEDIRCGGCVWLNQEIHKCIYSVKYPFIVSIEEMKERITNINVEQQNNLSESFMRFSLHERDKK